MQDFFKKWLEEYPDPYPTAISEEHSLSVD
jgi:hypothetical protein